MRSAYSPEMACNVESNRLGGHISPLTGRLLFRLTQWARRSDSLALYREIESAPFASRSEVLSNQFRRLSLLLQHAEARVPYYRDMFRQLGISSRDIRSMEDFARLPVLTKDIIRERGRDLTRDDKPIDSFLRHHSGGSTGVPLTFYRDHSYIDASDAGNYRNLAQSGWRPGEMVAFFWGYSEALRTMPRWQFELRQTLRRAYQFDPFRSGPQDMEGWLKRWKRLGATVALGYASTVARFAEYVEAAGQRVAPLRGVFTTAEKLYPQQRQVISRVFGCKVFDCYGSSEIQNIAAECPSGQMHINADFVVAETDGTSLPPGAAAPFIFTSLWNYSMPFIRYRNEDWGQLVDGHCDCGNNFPLMHLNVARISDNFVLPGGRVVHGEFFTHLMYGSRGIANFQFHQTAPDSINIWIVPTPGSQSDRERAVGEAVKEIRRLTPAELNIQVCEVESIPLSAAGKHRFTRSDVSAPALVQQ